MDRLEREQLMAGRRRTPARDHQGWAVQFVLLVGITVFIYLSVATCGA